MHICLFASLFSCLPLVFCPVYLFSMFLSCFIFCLIFFSRCLCSDLSSFAFFFFFFTFADSIFLVLLPSLCCLRCFCCSRCCCSYCFFSFDESVFFLFLLPSLFCFRCFCCCRSCCCSYRFTFLFDFLFRTTVRGPNFQCGSS